MAADAKIADMVGATLRSAAARSRQVAVRAVNTLLHPLECALLSRHDRQPAYPPLFIIGAPRSGSTVIYQTLVNCLEVGYFSNLHALLYGMPTIVERCYNARAHLDHKDYESSLGQTRGWNAPSECGEFWYRFYPRDSVALTEGNPPQRNLARLAKIVSRLTAMRSRPFLLKNLYCSLRLPSLNKAFPEALYLVVRRDEIATGHSLLAARRSRFGQYDAWFSVKPPTASDLDELPPHRQVIEQVRGIYNVIDRQRMWIGRDRFLDIEYERFCEDPKQTVQSVREFARMHGVELNVAGEIPQPFRRGGNLRIDTDLYEKMVTYARAS
jgi:hypothetical protein